MNYYLVLDTQKNNLGIDKYKIIDFSASLELNDILDFTTSFSSENELATYILKNNLADYDVINKPFRILQVDKDDNYKVLPYGIPFSEDKAYYKMTNIGDYLIDNLKDRNLLLEFYHTFNNPKDTTSPLAEKLRGLRYYISTQNNYDFIDNYSINNIIRDIIYIIGKGNRKNINLSNLHKMAMIIINNERKKDKKINKKEINNKKNRLEYVRELLRNDNLLPEEIEVLEREEYSLMYKLNDVEVTDENTRNKNSR